MRWMPIIAISLTISGCAEATSDSAKYIARDEQGREIATVTLPAPLPPESFLFRFVGDGGDVTSTYEHARTGSLDCYFSKGMPTICGSLPRDLASLPDRISDGSSYTIEGLGEFVRFTVGETDFAAFEGRKLREFGIVDKQGDEVVSYDRVPD